MQKFKRFLILFVASIIFSTSADAGRNTLSIRNKNLRLNGENFKMIGVRCSNALASNETTDQLISQLNRYKSFGINSFSVYMMGSRFGDVKGYRPNATLSNPHKNRLKRLIRAADSRGMVVLVGCLYWGTSEAKADLSGWRLADAKKAVGATAKFLKDNNFTNVLLDPDNEGQALRAKGWHPRELVAAAKSAAPRLIVGNNTKRIINNHDINIHFASNDTSNRPYVDTESVPDYAGHRFGNYWARYSKETYDNNGYYNYSRIGRYTKQMKRQMFAQTRDLIQNHSGVMLASTWLQCGKDEGVNGPFARLGGTSNMGNDSQTGAIWNRDIDNLSSRAGIRWWFNFIRNNYGRYVPPAP